MTTVVAFVVLASVMMFVLFFLLNGLLNRVIFYVFVAIFAYGSCIATTICLTAALRTLLPSLSAPAISYKKWKLAFAYDEITAALVALVIVLLWLFNRRSQWAWVPQDILGVSFMIMMLQQILLPDLKVSTIFLIALFCYGAPLPLQLLLAAASCRIWLCAPVCMICARPRLNVQSQASNAPPQTAILLPIVRSGMQTYSWCSSPLFSCRMGTA